MTTKKALWPLFCLKQRRCTTITVVHSKMQSPEGFKPRVDAPPHFPYDQFASVKTGAFCFGKCLSCVFALSVFNQHFCGIIRYAENRTHKGRKNTQRLPVSPYADAMPLGAKKISVGKNGGTVVG